MSHTMLEQTKILEMKFTLNSLFKDIFNFKETTANNFILNGDNMRFVVVNMVTGTSSHTFYDTFNNQVFNARVTTIRKASYHVSKKETVKYLKLYYDDGTYQKFIIAQDINGDWIVFYNDKMYTDYKTIGVSINPQAGKNPDIVSGDNMFSVTKAGRYDTGVEFAELYIVLSATDYTDTNCIVNFGGINYRLVSIMDSVGDGNYYPAFAFPVSD